MYAFSTPVKLKSTTLNAQVRVALNHWMENGLILDKVTNKLQKCPLIDCTIKYMTFTINLKLFVKPSVVNSNIKRNPHMHLIFFD